jgi:murein DD-endopeptidase MepM/ murein hydrolase activator NlpD
MHQRTRRPHNTLALIVLAALLAPALGCVRSLPGKSPSYRRAAREETPTKTPAPTATPTLAWSLTSLRTPGAPLLTPTPDAPHLLPTLRSEPKQYQVQAGDTLALIASRHGVGVEHIAQANRLANLDLLSVGQLLNIPPPAPQGVGPDFKIIPDSELVFGPWNILFNVHDFVQGQGGYLASYHEAVGEQLLSGSQIVERVARDFSVNPRLLLAALQYQSGWVSDPSPAKADLDYPLGLVDPRRTGLYRQLAWAANNLNRGFYLWRVGGVGAWLLSDGGIVPISPKINAGTAGVQQMYALIYDHERWRQAVSSQGIFSTYQAMFGYPFDYAIEPSLPSNLAQPPLQLPFEPGTAWAFTGGPHGAWGDGAAWAALDFAPPGDALGCVPSDHWVVAVADGRILRAGEGAVIQDLDGDGFEQTGWVILYMHVGSVDRVKPGTFLKAGERIGHPSCEGGISTGTHVHLARRYNGEWIPADQNVPFVMDGWFSAGTGTEYDGYLQRDGRRLEAYAGRSSSNGIGR